jgi:hypothetical protein
VKREEPFFSSSRIRRNIGAILSDEGSWLTEAYSLALQAEHLLRVVEGQRQHFSAEKRKRWTDEERQKLLADTRPAAQIAAEMGVSVGAIHAQRIIARRSSVEAVAA